MTQFSDTLRLGAAYYGRAGTLSGGERGVAVPTLAAVEFGLVAADVATGICVNATATAAGTLSATGSLVTGGVATMDVPRTVSLTSTGNNAAVTVTVRGTDQYGETQVASLAGPNATTVQTVSPFKTVISITVSAAVTGNISAGSASTLGLPHRLADLGKAVTVSSNGDTVAAADTTWTAAFTTTGTPTATTASVRGTVALATSITTGSNRITALMITDPTNKTTLYGLTPFAG